MPRFISKNGIWHPAKERIALKNLSGKVKIVDGKEVEPGDDYIYEGPDRASLFVLFKEKVETLGQDFRKNPEFLQAMRNQGFNNVEEYLELVGYDEKKIEEDFKKNAAVVNRGSIAKRVASVKTMGGGVDTAGTGKDKLGGFGPQPEG